MAAWPPTGAARRPHKPLTTIQRRGIHGIRTGCGIGLSVAPRDVVSVEKMDESIWGLKHRWGVVGVPDAKVPRYRLWFRFNSRARDEWLAKLAALKSA